MSFGDGDLHVQVAQLKTENARLKQQLGAMPEIVRCRDCEHMSHYWHHDCERWQCANEMLEGLDVYPSFYCAWGVRKEDGDD